MCGVTGRISFNGRDVISEILDDLIHLQNRGRDATGFVVGYSNQLTPYVPWKKPASAGSLFGKESEAKADTLIKRYKGNLGVGHVRYTTAGEPGENDNSGTQPHGFKHGGQSVVLASNGDIPFREDMRESLEQLHGCRLASNCDAEVLVNLVGLQVFRDRQDEVTAFANVGRSLQAAFSLAAMTPSGKLLGMRDPWGFRPLFWAKNHNGAMICSEMAPMKRHFKRGIHEVEPGTIVMFTDTGEVSIHRFSEPNPHFCLMEVFYFSQPNSTYRGTSFNELRYRLGVQAAREWLEAGYPLPDLVSEMPQSGGPAAQGVAHTLGCLLRNVVHKDRFGVTRNFMGRSADRVKQAEDNLDIIKEAVRGKVVMLVDDSVVRADQAKVVCVKLRRAKAKAVLYISTAPPYRYPCFFGLNTPEIKRLIAHGLTVEQVQAAIPYLDQLHYLSLEGSLKVLGGTGFCTGCFTGQYPMPVPDSKPEV